MKDGYRYKDGKIIVSDYKSYNGNVRQEVEREYQDNIKEILIAENMIEYFTGEKEKVKKEISDNQNSIYAKKIMMYIKAIPAIFINACLAGALSAIITLCLHLGGILSMISLDSIRNLALIICSIPTVIVYINKTIKPINSDIKNLKRELSVSEYALKEINAELEKQHELLKKLKDDKRKDNEESLAYDSEYKWTTNYIRLDYVNKIHEASSNLWNNVADEEDKLEKQQEEQHKHALTRKLTPSKYNRNK